MNIEKITITPELASKMLMNNESNRPLRQSKVKIYAKQMKNGEWQLNGEAISLSSSGELKNGQHRLSACVLANVPFETYVIYDNDSTIFDVGAKRSVSDLMMLKNKYSKVSYSIIVAAIRVHLILVANKIKFNTAGGQHSESAPTDTEIIIYSELNDKYLASAYSIVCMGKHNPISKRTSCVLACYYALKSGVPENVLESFFKVVNTGYSEGEHQYSAIMIRNNLIQKNFKSNSPDTVKQICLAINDFSKYKTRQKVYNISGSIPYMDDVIQEERENE